MVPASKSCFAPIWRKKPDTREKGAHKKGARRRLVFIYLHASYTDCILALQKSSAPDLEAIAEVYAVASQR
ncbi:hypothetical protein KT71_001343 [Congregibacter litoralis KT71]|uniref:Uncharacterized protein n=1 Tax=Congregibacter litoralis KT71 TaxID=314285 RepID=V7HSW2_9GAMM|nr:hypothetical protein KT71_001343 [Congregibacter litoralis KT71]